jgi:predicted RecA/RadA family phage recombinase
VYGASGWQNAGSSVNGTSQRYNYTATSGQTTFTGADNNGNTLTYDAGYIDVYLNGVKLLNGTDVTVTSGSSVVLASGATTGDVVDIVAYGTFSVASLNADNLTSGTVPDARITGAYTGITQTGTLTSFTSTGINDDATSNAITINSSNNVGIGETPPTVNQKLFVQGSNAALIMAEIKNISGPSALQITANNGTDARVVFGDLADNGRGRIIYSNSDESMRFDVNNLSEKMRIDSSGNLLVGKTSSSTATEGIELRASNLTTLTRSGNNVLTVNRLSNDGSLINLTKNSSTVGTISARFGGIQIGNSDTGLLFNDGSNEINPTNADGGINDNLTILGTNNRRFKDLYLGGGVYLGGTGTANHLDDYEEGTWTPTTNIGYANIYYAFYVKIGRLVFAHMYVQTNAGPGDTSQATAVSGLPFSAISGDVISNSNIIQGFNQDVYCEIGGSSFAQRDRSDNVLITRGEYGNKYQKCTIVYYTDA